MAIHRQILIQAVTEETRYRQGACEGVEAKNNGKTDLDMYRQKLSCTQLRPIHQGHKAEPDSQLSRQSSQTT